MSGQNSNTTVIESIWSIARIHEVVHQRPGKRPCWFQIQVAQALYLRQKDVVGISATGSGKTLSFWIPLIMALEEGKDVTTIVVTPLNLLGKQNVADLEGAGISAVAISAENANTEIFKVQRIRLEFIMQRMTHRMLYRRLNRERIKQWS